MAPRPRICIRARTEDATTSEAVEREMMPVEGSGRAEGHAGRAVDTQRVEILVTGQGSLGPPASLRAKAATPGISRGLLDLITRLTRFGLLGREGLLVADRQETIHRSN